MTAKNEQLSEIVSSIKANQKFVLCCHVAPDADAYGSTTALAAALQTLGKEVYLLNETGVLSNYTFLSKVSDFQDNWPSEHYDVLIVCDCGDRKRIGDRLLPHMPNFKTIINIDHHPTNDCFGTYNLVRASASSTAELAFEIITELQVALTKEIATALLAGLMGDTGSFNFPNTSFKVFETAALLLKAGASPNVISNNLFYNDSLSCVKLKAEALSNVEVFVDGKVAITIVDQKLLSKYNSTSGDLDGLVDQVRRISGIQIAILIYRDADRWKVSMRAKQDHADLARVAADFGGGGHRQAAGFRSTQEVSVLKTQIISRIEQELLQ